MLRIGIVGAGDYAFLRFAVEQIDAQLVSWVDTHKDATLDDVKDAIQSVITEIHHEHLYPYGQPHERPEIKLLVGVMRSDGGFRLYQTHLTSVTKVWNYEAIGIGGDLANFLVKRFYAERIPWSSAAFWASYVLMHAKKYVPGCGGASDVVAIVSGSAGHLKQETVAKYEKFAHDFENAMHPVFLAGAAIDKQDQFMAAVDRMATTLKTLSDPLFLTKQAEQVRRDITLQAGTPTITFSAPGAHLIASGMAAIDPMIVTPSKPETNAQTTETPIQESPKRDH